MLAKQTYCLAVACCRTISLFPRFSGPTRPYTWFRLLRIQVRLRFLRELLRFADYFRFICIYPLLDFSILSGVRHVNDLACLLVTQSAFSAVLVLPFSLQPILRPKRMGYANLPVPESTKRSNHHRAVSSRGSLIRAPALFEQIPKLPYSGPSPPSPAAHGSTLW